MSKPDVSVNLWASHIPDLAFVTVKLSAQSAADLRAVMKLAWGGCGDRDVDCGAWDELERQLAPLTLPEPTRP